MSEGHLNRWVVTLTFCLAVAAASMTAVSAQAQTYTDLHDFKASAGDPTNFNVDRPAQGARRRFLRRI